MNHRRDFGLPGKLIQTLIEAWEHMTKVHTEPMYTEWLDREKEDVDLLLAEIKGWNKDKDMSQYQNHLEHLLKIKGNVVRASMNLHAWPNLYLSQVPVQNYLRSVMDAWEHLCIKNLMKQLVCPSDVHLIKDLTTISEWLYKTNLNKATGPLEYIDLVSLKTLLDQAKEDVAVARAKSTMYTESADQQGVRIIATTTVAHAINHIRGNLSEAKYEELFLLTLLFPLGYDVNEKIFLHPLSICDLEYLYRELEEQSEEFFKMVQRPIINLQSYLFHLAARVHNSDLINEAQIKSHLQYIEKEVQSELDPQVHRALSQFYAITDWKVLQSELVSLAKDKLVLETHEVRLLKALTDTSDGIQSEVPSTASDLQQENEELLRENVKVQKLFRVPGFEKYYPQKLTLQDALLIRQETLGKVHYSDIAQLPFMILQKIMMNDYRCRTVLVHHKPGNGEDSDGDSSNEDESSTDKTELQGVHPMDGLLALLHCSDNFLRQDLMTRLSTCQLALPFLLPDPFTKKLTLSLWAMRSIVKEWKCVDSESGSTISSESPIVNHLTPIISFFRLSRNKTQLSKSRILNCVISDSHHNHFFHYHCGTGGNKQLIVDGLVELCWYLPSGNEEDPFPNVITFTNLRGDARHHPKQTKFLSQVSFMNFVLLAANDLNKRGIEVLQELSQAPGGLVLMFHTKVKKEEEQLLSTIQQYHSIKLRNRSEDDLKRAIQDKINEKLLVSGSEQHSRNLIDCAEVAHDVGIDVDEDDPACIQGKKIATDLKEKLSSVKTAIKSKIFPLQGRELWHQWAKHDKELHRHRDIGFKTVEQYISQKEEEKLLIRGKQLSQAENSNPIIYSFISSLLNYTGTVRNYFLQWLKLILDQDSRASLSQLRSQYQEKRQHLLQLQRGHESDEAALEGTKKEIEALNDELVNVSFGLEHFLRELGQIYEAVLQQDVSPQLRAQVSRLPEAAAELLASGYPLELMDGDAAHVPIQWVMAVLSKVREQLGDIKLLVLSVLGVQSSGKSTLLNAMFGVRFAVSAGRCTRGAFIQLVPLGESLKTRVNCDYLLVVDTEGLRAPEVSLSRLHKHDNEMATFVIGLANVTIINIFGETPGEMEDILQTAVHAFIRMKRVKLNPSCQFVHQNVGEMMAKDKGMISRVKFQEKLDEMTTAAATQEHCQALYKRFSDVIEFSDRRDEWYFPTLWNGTPPMAPRNPLYGERACTLKSGLIDFIEMKGVQYSLSTFQIHIQDLWQAVLNESFVFSFKNTLETTAYKHLDTTFSQWSWTFQHKMLAWDQQAENTIESTKIQELPDLQRKLINKQLPAHVDEIHKGLCNDMNKFFEEDDQHDILAQWKAQTEVRMVELKVEREALTKHHCKSFINSRLVRAKAEGMKHEYRDKLLHQVKVIASNMEKGELSEAELEQKFEENWAEWMQEFLSDQVHRDDPDIEECLENCLKKSFRTHNYLLIDRLKNNGLRTRIQEPLTFKVKRGNAHVSASRNWGNWWGKLTSSHLDITTRETYKFIDKAINYLKTKKNQNFNRGFCEELLMILLQAIDEGQKDIQEFTFTPEYRVDLALTVFGHAMTVFEKMADNFRKKNDPIEYLQREMKLPFLRLYKSQYHQSAKEKTAADNLYDILVKPMEKAVIGSLGLMVVAEMKSSHNYFHAKMALKAKILHDLAEKGSFDDYVLYLTNVKLSLQTWIKHYTERFCEQNQGEKSRLNVLAERKLQQLIAQIGQTAKTITESCKSLTGEFIHDTAIEPTASVELSTILPPDTTESEPDIKQWLHNFHGVLKEHLPMDLSEMQLVVGAEELKDFEFFTEEFCHSLEKLTIERFEALNDMDSWDRRPYDILTESLVGCCEQCPFCQEQCEYDHNHESSVKHSIELHRPQCLSGRCWVETGKMALELCTSLVGSESRFRSKETKSGWHPYNTYTEMYPSWSIVPNASLQASSYWKWFVANYTKKIAAHFEIQQAEIPQTWKNLKLERVKEDLQQLYNL